MLGERVRMIKILSLDAPKSILETERTLKTLSSGQTYQKTKKPPKNQKTQKKLKNPPQKNPLGWFFF
jgi:hypothetical protein